MTSQKGEVLFHFIIVQLLSEYNEGLITIHLLELTIALMTTALQPLTATICLQHLL